MLAQRYWEFLSCSLHISQVANYTTNKNNFGLQSIQMEIFMQNFVLFVLAQSRGMKCL